ncbi:energy-coupling factor transporter ATPase [Sesbania bispinosa]|nr:energy-coupling factor transporter ATPase [Sesbania bispinosa]
MVSPASNSGWLTQQRNIRKTDLAMVGNLILFDDSSGKADLVRGGGRSDLVRRRWWESRYGSTTVVALVMASDKPIWFDDGGLES